MSDGVSRLHRYGFFFALFLLVCARVYHMDAPLDEPHSWRQADTANYARDLVRGADVLHPTVCWQGERGVVILEFPAYQALVAALYQLVGERLVVARAVTIACWLGSLVYLYLVVALVYDRRLARAASLVYATLPLGVYYSRAVHIDFAVLFAALGMLYHFLRGLSPGRYLELIPGATLGALAFAMKAPYAFFLYLPLLYQALRHRLLLRTLMALPFLALPATVFWAWRAHTEAVNAQAPDLSFIPGYFKLIDMDGWYFGTLAQRLDTGNWLELAKRVGWETLTPVGTLLALMGLWAGRKQLRTNAFAEVWAVGAAGYLLIFFNVNLVHNYYQIPLLAIASIYIARGLIWLWDLEWPPGGAGSLALTCPALTGPTLTRLALTGPTLTGAALGRPAMARAAAAGLALALVGNAGFVALRSYYRVDWLRVAAGREIEARTGDDDLVIASIAETDPRDPRLLYRARRHGFSIAAVDLNPLLIERLRNEGATVLALVQAAGEGDAPPALFTALSYESIRLEHDGAALGRLYLASLR